MDEHELRAGRSSGWALFAVAWLLLAAFFLYGWSIYPDIPDRIPGHWGARGQVDRWDTKSFGTVFLPLFIALGVGALTQVLAVAIPGLTVLPQDATAHRRIRAEGATRGTRWAMGAVFLLSVALIGYLAALGWRAQQDLTLWPVLLFVALVWAVLWFSYRAGDRWAARFAAEHGVHPSPEEAAEDRLWLPMGIYNNPDDPRMVVPKREGYGIGTTINWASRGGKLFTVGMLVVAVVSLVVPLLLPTR